MTSGPRTFSTPISVLVVKYKVSDDSVRRWCETWLPALLVGPGCWRVCDDFEGVIEGRTAAAREERESRKRAEALRRSQRRAKRFGIAARGAA